MCTCLYHPSSCALLVHFVPKAQQVESGPQRLYPAMSSRKPLPPPPRPSLKRSLTSMMSTLTRKPSRTPRRVSSWDPTWQSQPAPRRVRIAPEPHPWASRPPRFDIVESGGLALADAQDAFTDSRRAVWTRIVWSLPVEHDVGARGLMDRVGERDVAEGLAKLGVGFSLIFCGMMTEGFWGR